MPHWLFENLFFCVAAKGLNNLEAGNAFCSILLWRIKLSQDTERRENGIEEKEKNLFSTLVDPNPYGLLSRSGEERISLGQENLFDCE